MYISLFWCGVIATVVAEFAITLILALRVGSMRKDEEDGPERDTKNN